MIAAMLGPAVMEPIMPAKDTLTSADPRFPLPFLQQLR
jgi:hypothetical protein